MEFSDEMFRAMTANQFELSITRPDAWATSAERLFTSCEILAQVIAIAEERDIKRLSAPNPSTEGGRQELSDEEKQDLSILLTRSVWAMLVSFAFENLLKGIIVGKAVSRPESGSLPADLNTHMLIPLAEAADFTLSESQTSMLEVLTEYGLWAGRYSAPTNKDKLYQFSKRLHDNPLNYHPLWPISQRLEDCRSLYRRMLEEFEIIQQTRRNTENV